MHILFLGDVVGRSGRDAVVAALPKLRADLRADLVVVIAKNASHGFGLDARWRATCWRRERTRSSGTTPGTARKSFRISPRRRGAAAAEFPAGYAGRRHRGGRAARRAAGAGAERDGAAVHGRARLPVSRHRGRAGPAPAWRHGRGRGDRLPAEASSEKMAFGHWFDGQASLIVGTHTHTPTSDHRSCRAAPRITDAGMCGDYDSVIGMLKEGAISRFWRKLPGERLNRRRGRRPSAACSSRPTSDRGAADRAGAGRGCR